MVRKLLVAALAASSTALSTLRREATEEPLYTIELAPGETQIVTEDEKFQLRKEGKGFIDITNHPNLASGAAGRVAAAQDVVAKVFPGGVTHAAAVNALLPELSLENLESTLTAYSEIFTHYYNSDYGAQTTEWMQSQIEGVISGTAATVKTFAHSFPMSSLIVTIPGQSAQTIVVGAHLDSVGSTRTGRSPGADDDGSGSMTILEALRVLLTDPAIAGGEAPNTIEFHWYAGEEGGLLGSSDIFDQYASDGVDVAAMLQQDMTAYVGQGDSGAFGVVTDNVDASLTAFLRTVIDAYTTVGYVNTKCGYGCSDHASATAAGYPSSFIFESEFALHNPHIHSAEDTLDYVSYDHMLEHAKLVVGYVYELGFAGGL